MSTNTLEHLVEGCTCSGKICYRCRQKKCSHAFPRDRRQRDGRYWNCRTCCSEYRAKRRQTHSDAVCVIEHNTRARQKNVATTFTTQEWTDLKAFYHHRCLCCGKQEPEIKLTPDHVIPLSKGGTNAITNIQPLCLSCNLKKATQSTDFRSSHSAIS